MGGVSQVDLAALAWSLALRRCEPILTRITKALAQDWSDGHESCSWQEKLKASLGPASAGNFSKKMDSDYWDFDTISQLWQTPACMTDVLLPAMQLEVHDLAADRLREVMARLYKRRAELAKDTPSLAIAFSALSYLEELLVLLYKHVPESLDAGMKEDVKAAEAKVKRYVAMSKCQGGSGPVPVTVTVTSHEFRTLLLILSLKELNGSLKPHIKEAIDDCRLPQPAAVIKNEKKRIVYDVVSLCEYLTACIVKPGVTKEEVAHLRGRKIKNLDQILKLMVSGRHQLHHSDANTEKWIEQNLKKVMKGSAALLEAFSGVSAACDSSLGKLEALMQSLADADCTVTEDEEKACHTLTVQPRGVEDDLGQLQVPFLSIAQQLVGREDLIESVADLVARADPSPEERRVTLYGLPGTGKTVTAIEVIKQVEKSKPTWHCAWLRGGTVEELQQGLDQFARAAVPSVQQEDKSDEALRKLKAWLSRDDTAVLVIDDATEESLEYIEGNILTPGQGRVLMTGSKALCPSSWELKTFSVEDSVALIRQKFQRRFNNFKADEVFRLTLVDGGNRQMLREFLSGDLVDNLPLTVDQVGRLLVAQAEQAGLCSKSLSDEDRQEKSRDVLANAIKQFNNAASAVEASSLPRNDRHLRGLMGTVRLWVDRIRSLPDKELSGASLGLLQACAILAKQDIPWSLLQTYLSMRHQTGPIDAERDSSASDPEPPAVSDGASGVPQTADSMESAMQELSLNNGRSNLQPGSELQGDPGSSGQAEIAGEGEEVENEESVEQGADGRNASDGDDIPEEETPFYLHDEMTKALELMERSMEVLEAFGRLVVVSGSDSDGMGRSASMHGALQDCIRKELSGNCPGLREALTSRFNGRRIEFAERREMELWRPSVVSFLTHPSEPDTSTTDSPSTEVLNAKLRSSIGLLLHDQGLYGQSEPYLLQVMTARRAELGERHPDTLKSINNLGLLYKSQGRYADAEPLFSEALEGMRAELGERHPHTLSSINNLGSLYESQGRYADAEPLYLEALKGCRAEMRERHPDTLISINNLGSLYKSQGRYADAEPLLLEALECRRAELGERHPDTLGSINKLAWLYESQGRYADAEPLLLEALEGRRAELGERHPSTLTSINNLGSLYMSQGRYADAEPLYLEALECRRAELGERHPDTLTSINNLGSLYMSQGRYSDAEPLYLEALEGRRAELGERHPDTLTSINNLGSLYMSQGRYSDAEPLYLEALEGRRAELGERHPSTLGSINNLAMLYESQGRYADAEPLYLEALEGRRAELGERHPSTLTSINNLGSLYKSQGRYADAEPLYLEALEGMRAELGERHPHTLGSINNLAMLYESQGRYSDAEPLFLEALEGMREELGERHPHTLGSINNLAGLYKSQGRYADAEPLYLEALEGRRAELGERHPSTLISINNLDGLYQSQGRYADAEPLYLEALEGMRAELGERHPDTLMSINNLGLLYKSQGRYSDAEPLFLETLEGKRVELGERHPDTLMSINNLAMLYESQGRYADAEPLLLEALEGRREELGERHPHTLGSINNLAGLYMKMENFLAAAELLHDGLRTAYTHGCRESFDEDWKEQLSICREVITSRDPKEKCPCGSGKKRQKCHPSNASS